MHKAVIGLGFGDEGKGSVVNYLVPFLPNGINVRFSGGHQVGHTVTGEDFRHVFSNFGSATFRGMPTYWSEHCTVDPVGFMKELQLLETKGIKPKIYIHGDCPITTPYDKFANMSRERENQHGSCGVGFGATIQREEDFYSLTFRDLYYPQILLEKTRSLAENYYKEKHVDKMFFKACLDMINYKGMTMVDKAPISEWAYKYAIFEGSQGLLLDQHFGFFPNVTRSDLGSKNILSMLPYPSDMSWYFVTRAYQTRHGNGFMTNTEIPHNIKKNPDETNVTNEFQGDFRRTLLDVSLLKYAMEKDPHIRIVVSTRKTLVITCLDHIEDEYRFTYEGIIQTCKNKKEFINKVCNLLGFHKCLINEGKGIKEFILG